MNLIVVRAAYDPDAKVWSVEDSAPLNGLNIEAATIDELRDKLPAAVIDLLETKTPGADIGNRGASSHMHTRVRKFPWSRPWRDSNIRWRSLFAA